MQQRESNDLDVNVGDKIKKNHESSGYESEDVSKGCGSIKLQYQQNLRRRK